MNNSRFKFRIWSKEHGQMFFSDNCPLSQNWVSADKREFAFCMDYDDVNRYGNLSVSYRLKLEEYKNITQFTGLLDKNNKEIYEGDIVKLTLPGYCHDQQNFKIGFGKYACHFGEGYIDDTEYGYYFTSKKSGNWTMAFSDTQSEIIGNIFQNPELLND